MLCADLWTCVVFSGAERIKAANLAVAKVVFTPMTKHDLQDFDRKTLYHRINQTYLLIDWLLVRTDIFDTWEPHIQYRK